MGKTKTYKRLKAKYFWLGMSGDVADFVQACIPCNQRKRTPVNPVYPLKPLEVEEKPFSRVNFDILGPLPLTENGNKYILGIQCAFSKFLIARPIADRKTETIADTLTEFLILPHGCPQVMVSDNAAEFVSELMDKLAVTLNIDKRTCTPMQASTNGQVERSFSTISNLISTMVNRNQTNWDTLTKFVVHSYNNTENDSTAFTPMYLSTGREITIHHDLCYPVKPPRSYNDEKDYVDLMRESLFSAWTLARDHIEMAQESYKFYHDLQIKGHDFVEGDIVYVKVPRVAPGNVKKFTSPYHGPYIITKLRGLNADIRALGISGHPVGVEFVTHL